MASWLFQLTSLFSVAISVHCHILKKKLKKLLEYVDFFQAVYQLCCDSPIENS